MEPLLFRVNVTVVERCISLKDFGTCANISEACPERTVSGLLKRAASTLELPEAAWAFKGRHESAKRKTATIMKAFSKPNFKFIRIPAMLNHMIKYKHIIPH
ncbi:MAG: hypothetical protein NZ926_02690 [Candidatus Methanomethylicia archaeon]|nr:hypothetical protein [Candidatus Methanomethylicia archaeon]